MFSTGVSRPAGRARLFVHRSSNTPSRRLWRFDPTEKSKAPGPVKVPAPQDPDGPMFGYQPERTVPLSGKPLVPVLSAFQRLHQGLSAENGRTLRALPHPGLTFEA